MLEVSRSSSGVVMTIEKIAREQRVPKRYLEAILNQLRKGGLLEAQRGRRGGYRLAKDVREITVGEVVKLIDGPIRAVACAEERRGASCPQRDNCVFVPTWRKVQDAINQALDSTTFSQLLKLESEANQKSSPSYVI
jgi:Rrf2 family protein